MRRAQTLAEARALLVAMVLGAACGSADAPTTPAASTLQDQAPIAAAPIAAAPGAVPAPALRVVAVAAGGRTSYALMSDGTLRAWGDGGSGELGAAAVKLATTPIEVAGIAGVKSITAGGPREGTACAILEGGTVKCWGSAWSFPLGVPFSQEAVPPTEIAELAGATEISIGHGYGCAVMGNGELRCWGRVPASPEQRVTRQHRDLVPFPELQGVTMVRSGSGHVCALASGGTVSCWGMNHQSQAVPSQPHGHGQKVLRPTAVEGITGAIDIGVATHFTCAMLADHTVRCWGERPRGDFSANFPAGSVHALDAGIDATAFSTGASGTHVCLLGSAGRARCLGDNGYKQLGIALTKTLYTTTPLEVPGLEGIVSLVAAAEHTCAATQDGGAWCWGTNAFGGLGDGTATDRSDPKPVSHITATTLPPLAPPVYPPGLAQDLSNLPEGCASEKLRFTTDLTDRTEFEVRVTRASFSEDRRGLSVYLRTYVFDPPFTGEWVLLPRPGQLGITAHFSRVSVRYRRASEEQRFMDPSAIDRIAKPLALVPGIYKQALDWVFTEPEPRVQPTVNVELATDRALQGVESNKNNRKAQQQVELTYIGKDWVCGEFSFSGRSNSLSGRFAAKVHDD